MELPEYRRMAEQEDRHWWYRSTRALLAELLGGLLPPGGRYLDVGAGTGARLAEHGSLLAVDVEPMALALHRERHPSSAVVACDAGALPFPDATFDAVVEITVLYHRAISEPAAAVAEMARVVRPGGVVMLWEPGGRRLLRPHDRETHAARRFARRDVAALL